MAAIVDPSPHQLGALIDTYRYSRSAAVWLGIRLIFIGIGALILLVAASQSASGDLLLLGGLGLVWLLLSSGVLVHWRWKHAFDIAVYDAGLVYTVPRETVILCWDDICAVRQQHIRSTVNGVPLGVFYGFGIETTSGRVLTFTNAVERIAQFGQHIQQATFPHLWAQALAAYERDAIVPFGPLGISCQGLHLHQKLLRWPEVRDIQILDGTVRIRQHGKWRAWGSLAVADMDNIHVALALLNHHMAPDHRA